MNKTEPDIQELKKRLHYQYGLLRNITACCILDVSIGFDYDDNLNYIKKNIIEIVSHIERLEMSRE